MIAIKIYQNARKMFNLKKSISLNALVSGIYCLIVAYPAKSAEKELQDYLTLSEKPIMSSIQEDSPILESSTFSSVKPCPTIEYSDSTKTFDESARYLPKAETSNIFNLLNKKELAVKGNVYAVSLDSDLEEKLKNQDKEITKLFLEKIIEIETMNINIKSSHFYFALDEKEILFSNF